MVSDGAQDDTPLSLFMWSQMIFRHFLLPFLCSSVCALFHSQKSSYWHNGWFCVSGGRWLTVNGSAVTYKRIFMVRKHEKRVLLTVMSRQCHITCCPPVVTVWWRRRQFVFCDAFWGKPVVLRSLTYITYITAGILFESGATQHICEETTPKLFAIFELCSFINVNIQLYLNIYW